MALDIVVSGVAFQSCVYSIALRGLLKFSFPFLLFEQFSLTSSFGGDFLLIDFVYLCRNGS